MSDKIISHTTLWMFMVFASAAIDIIAFVSRSWAVVLATPISVLGGALVLSFVDDPFFGDAVLQERGWTWFAINLTACLLPVMTVLVTRLCHKRSRPGSQWL